ncbi:MAG: DNA topoisomerase IB [Actinomycetota bacterium]
MPRLRRVDCSGPGIRRKGRGKGFTYADEDGRPVGPEERARIRTLAIPPAWKGVWICPDPYGHLQATGTDAAGRKQYLYHELWRIKQDRQKFDDMLDFARCLPHISRVCDEKLAADGLGRERVLACALRLLYRGSFRIGSEGYAEQNQTYGLATILKRHVSVKGDEMTFDYVAKGNKKHTLTIPDPVVAPVIGALKRRRGGGSELLAFRMGASWVDVRSADINLYIKEITGRDFSAKDFRTWSATALAAIGMAVSQAAAGSKTGRKRAIARTIKDVAGHLDNTPAVCRTSYIDPRIFDRFLSGWVISVESLDENVDSWGFFTDQALIEAVVDLLEDNRSSETLEKIA